MSKTDWPANKIEMRNVSELVPYANNSRTHSPQQVDQIAASINEWGWTMPVLVDENGMLIAGHGRIMAAQKLGIEQVPTMTAKGWTEAQKKAYVIADNKLALNADWDMELLGIELQELQELDFDLELTGFDEDEIASITPLELEEGLTDEDAVPELQDEPVSKTGDVWLLGKHRLMCGDSTSIDAVEKLMAGSSADMIFTDPPYGMSYDGGRSKKNFGMIKNDDAQGGALVDLVRDAIATAKANSKDGASAYVCFPWRTYSEFEAALVSCGLEVNCCIVWDKKSVGLGHQDYRPQHEFIFYSKGGQFYGDRSQSDVWYMSRGNTGAYVHPTQKPVELIEKAISNSSKGGDVVIDCFGGSGSTLIACEKTGRHARLMELDPKYCDVIIRRWQDFTGKEAVLEQSGDKFNDMYIIGRNGDAADA